MKNIKSILKVLVATVVLSGCAAKKDKPKPNHEEQRTKATLSLHEAILKQDVLQVKEALSSGADVNRYDHEGYTPIIKAVQMGNPIIVRDLLNAGVKVFKPTENDENIDIFFSLDSSKENEILNLVKAEVEKLGAEAEELINSRDTPKTLIFFKHNFLPPTLMMPGRKETALSMTARYTDKGSDLSLFEHLVFNSKTKKDELMTVTDELLRVSSDIKSVSLLSKLISKYENESTAHRFSTIVVSDYDLNWLKEKLGLLRSKGTSVDIEEVKAPYKDSKFYFNSSVESKLAYESLLAEVLMIETSEGSTYDRNNLVQIAITDLSYRAYTDLSFLDWIRGSVEVWKSHRPALPSTGYSFDERAVVLIQALERNTSYDITQVRATFDSLALFANRQENKSEESFKQILGSTSLKDHHKQELLKVVLEKTHIFPDNIMSLAIENGGYSTLKVLLDAGVRIDPATQGSSILTAVVESTSTGEAVESLNLLSSYGVSLNSDYGADATLAAFNRSWDQNEEDYENVALFITTKEPLLFNNIRSERVQNLVKEILRAVRERKQDWSILNTVFTNIPESVHYTRKLSLADTSFDVEMSLLWDLMLTLYEVYDFNYDNIDPVIGLIDWVSKKYDSENNSMALNIDDNDLDKTKNLTHGILPVSLLFSAGAEEAKQSIHSSNDDGYRTLNDPNKAFSIDVFLNSAVYAHYSEERNYWKEVSKIMIKNAKSKIVLKNDRSSSDFYKILVDAGLIRSFRGLVDVLDLQAVKLSAHEVSCSFEKSSANGLSGSDYINNLLERHSGRPNDSISLSNHSKWTSLGSFEVLKSFKSRTCDGENLTDSEVSFINSYVTENYTTPVRSTNRYITSPIKALKDCTSLNADAFNPVGKLNYTAMGVRTEISDIEGVVPAIRRLSFSFNKCIAYPHDETLHNRAKKQFLESWFNCAKTLDRNKAINLFEGLSSSFNLTPNDHIDSSINVCRM